MKTKSVIFNALFILICLFFLTAQKADAKKLIVWGSADKLQKIANLPDSAFYQTEDSRYFDLGIKYTVLHIFWVPVWVTKNAVACGYIDKENYVELSDTDVKLITQKNNLDITGKIKPRFWDRFGGKGIFSILIILAIWGFFPIRKY